jgi:hypothetical protein
MISSDNGNAALKNRKEEIGNCRRRPRNYQNRERKANVKSRAR